MSGLNAIATSVEGGILRGPSRRVAANLKSILSNAKLRKELMVGVLIATQAREGIATTVEQAEAAYDKIQAELSAGRPVGWRPFS